MSALTVRSGRGCEGLDSLLSRRQAESSKEPVHRLPPHVQVRGGGAPAWPSP